jgi:hypothetical protein
MLVYSLCVFPLSLTEIIQGPYNKFYKLWHLMSLCICENIVKHYLCFMLCETLNCIVKMRFIFALFILSYFLRLRCSIPWPRTAFRTTFTIEDHLKQRKIIFLLSSSGIYQLSCQECSQNALDRLVELDIYFFIISNQKSTFL